MKTPALKIGQQVNRSNHKYLSNLDFFENLFLNSLHFEDTDLRGAHDLGFSASRTCKNFCECEPEGSDKIRPDGCFYGDPQVIKPQVVCCQDRDGYVSIIPASGFSLIEEDQLSKAGIINIIEGPNETYPPEIENQNSEQFKISSQEMQDSFNPTNAKRKGPNLMLMITNESIRRGYASLQSDREVNHTPHTSPTISPLKRRKLASDREEFKKIKNKKIRKQLQRNKKFSDLANLASKKERKEISLKRKMSAVVKRKGWKNNFNRLAYG